MNTLTNWTLAALAAFFMSAASMLDPDPNDSGLAEAQHQAMAQARQDQAAAQLCVKAAGPGSRPQWRTDGVLECVPKRHQVMVAGGS